MPERPNWFIALPVDGAFLAALPPPPEAIKLFPAPDVHLTLAFLGKCDEQAAAAALSLLESRLRQCPVPSFHVTLGEVVPMGSPRRYSALSALLREGQPTASALIGDHRDVLLDAAGAPADTRPPKPHVTLARPRRRAGKPERRAGQQWAAGLDLSAVRQRLERIALYTWSHERPQRLFRIVADLPLS
jgi:2'-5' RNA ligase